MLGCRLQTVHLYSLVQSCIRFRRHPFSIPNAVFLKKSIIHYAIRPDKAANASCKCAGSILQADLYFYMDHNSISIFTWIFTFYFYFAFQNYFPNKLPWILTRGVIVDAYSEDIL